MKDFNYWDATVFYQEGSIVKWHDGTIVKAKSDTCGNPDDWYDPQKGDQYGRLMEQKCSCGSRQKSKCVKESGLGNGKMCLKAEDSLYINFRDTLNGGFCADIDYESEAWQKVLSDWEGFKECDE